MGDKRGEVQVMGSRIRSKPVGTNGSLRLDFLKTKRLRRPATRLILIRVQVEPN